MLTGNKTLSTTLIIVFLIIFIVFIVFMIINIWAIIALIINIHRLSWIAIIAGIIFLFIFPPITLVIVYALREPEHTHHMVYQS